MNDTLAYWPLAKHMAHDFCSHSYYEYEDLVSEAMVGVLRKGPDNKNSARLIIRSSMVDYLRTTSYLSREKYKLYRETGRQPVKPVTCKDAKRRIRKCWPWLSREAPGYIWDNSRLEYHEKWW